MRNAAAIDAPLRELPQRWRLAGFAGLALLLFVPLLQHASPYTLVLMIDI